MIVTKAWATTAIVVAGVVTAGVYAPEGSASPQEDDPGWSCVDDGNRVCGPQSDDWGHTPGCYDDGGVLVALWPCEAWKLSDGYRHPDGTITWPEGCQINLYTQEIDCSGRDLGPDWDSNPSDYFV